MSSKEKSTSPQVLSYNNDKLRVYASTSRYFRVIYIELYSVFNILSLKNILCINLHLGS